MARGSFLREVDNRSTDDMMSYNDDRIVVLKRRLQEVEDENKLLHSKLARLEAEEAAREGKREKKK